MTATAGPLSAPERAREVVDAVGPLPFDPWVLAIAAAFLALALLLVGWHYLRRRRAPARRLQRVLGPLDEVSILMHPNPDPDAMACALGVAELAEDVNTTAHVHYAGQIRHQENRAFRTVLDLDFDRVESADELAADHVVLVDHNEPRGMPGADGIEPYAVIDHHPGGGTGVAFTDVRTDYGACASVVAEYFETLGAAPAPEDGDEESDLLLPSDVATGLMYGVQADTDHLTKGCSAAEFDACRYLYPAVDEDQLTRIANPQVDAEVLEVKARAITHREVEGPYCVADVGEVSNADAIPQAADELVNLEGVTAVVVMGRRNGTLHLSGRSHDDRVHIGDALDVAVEDIPMASAGGHARMGGGQVSIDHMNGLGPSSGLSEEELVDRLFRVMEGDA